MTLEKIINELREEGEKKKEKLIAEGEREAHAIKNTAMQQAEEIKSRYRIALASELERLKVQALSSAELEARRIILRTQKELLDMLYKRVLSALATLPTEQNEALLRLIFACVKRELLEGAIYSNERDEQFVKLYSGYTFASTINCAGGVIVESSDHRVRVDYRYETLLNDIWTKNLKEIATALFR